MGPVIKRHVNWSKIGARADNWHRVYVNGGHEPDKMIAWVEENLTGEWTSKPMSDEQVIKKFGEPPRGRFFSEYRFADKADHDKFALAFGGSAGTS